MTSLFGENTELLQKVLDLRMKRQNIVSGNLANSENPDYKARRLKFEEKLQNSLQLSEQGNMTRTEEEHLPTSFDSDLKPDFYKEFEGRVVKGEDAVDMDNEMSIQNQNTVLYNTLTTLMKMKFDGMEKVIRSGSQ
ncbi:MAG: flagellar basal body rod protein FlgB [Thermodesulfobacteriota bacterium]